MKKMTTWPVFLLIGLILSLGSCKKSNPNGTEDDSVSASDNTSVSNAMNTTSEDAANAADAVGGLSRGKSWAVICGSEDSSTTPTSITITYDSTSVCGGEIRSGTIAIALTSGTKWSDAGAVITVTVNVGVTDPVTSSHFNINGSFTITNENGGIIPNLLVNNSVVIKRRHQGSMQITWPNGSTRTWTFDRTFAWSIGTVGAEPDIFNLAWSTEASNGVESSGTNRYGNTFTNTIDSTVQLNDYACTNNNVRLDPYVGMYTHHVDNRTASIQFGTDNNGVSQDNPADCASTNYGWYLRYQNTKTGVSAALFWPYWGY